MVHLDFLLLAFLFKKLYLFLAVLVFIAAYGLSLFVESMGYSSLHLRASHCSGSSCGAQALGL